MARRGDLRARLGRTGDVARHGVRRIVDLVDIHSHVIPAVDDGSPDLATTAAMLAAMVASGTTTLWGTPHVADRDGFPGSPTRLALIGERFAELPAVVPDGLTVRRGHEVTPSPERLAPGADVAALALDGLDIVLVDGPDDEPAAHDDLFLPYIERVLAEGLRPVIAHPERRAAHPDPDPGFAERLAEAGALLQVDACSLLGADGAAIKDDAWRIVGDGLASLVASDAHTPAEAADLGKAHAAIEARFGLASADCLCGGTVLSSAQAKL
jgi:protein-tyrosine phosphatase